jgi:hypothetical protein
LNIWLLKLILSNFSAILSIFRQFLVTTYLVSSDRRQTIVI